MTAKLQALWLVDEAELVFALETSPSGRLWNRARLTRETGTGRDIVRIDARDGAAAARFEFGGPTVIGLGDAELERERMRMMRVVHAAQTSLEVIEAHLAYRRGLAAPRTAAPGVAPATGDRAGGVEIRHAFHCATSGAVAGTLALRSPQQSSEKRWVELSGFALTGDTQWSVDAEVGLRLRSALLYGDARALLQHNVEMVPFFCPACDCSYAASVWQAHHDSATSVDGVCPAGHRRRLCA